MFRSVRSRLVSALALALVLPSGAVAQVPAEAAPAASDTYTESEVREDFETLYRTLQEAEYDPYARVTKAEYDARFEELLAGISGPMPKDRAHLLFQNLLAFGRISHAHTEAALLDVLGALGTGKTLFPLDVVYRDSMPLLAGWPDSSDALPPGSHLLELDGEPMASIDARFREIVSADTDTLLHAQLEKGFPIYLALVFPNRSELTVTAIRPDGSKVTHKISAIGYGELKALQQERPVPSLQTDFGSREYRIDDGIGYLRPGPFANLPGEVPEGTEGYHPEAMKAFLKEAFAAFETAGVENVLVDLRGNPGGDNSFSDPLIARFADRPFRFASQFNLRASAATKARYAKEKPAPGSLFEKMVAAEADAPNGSRYTLDLPLVEPVKEGRFKGRVRALINRQSYSNAVTVAAILKDYGFATILGEETADLATTYGSVEQFNLPNSKVQIFYPKSYIVRPDGDETVHGVRPDIPLSPQPIGVSEDTVLRHAYAVVKEER